MIKNGIRDDRFVETFLYMLECVPTSFNLGATFYLSANGKYEKVKFDDIKDCYLLREESPSNDDILIIEYVDWYIGTRSLAAIKKKSIHRYILYHFSAS